MDCFYCPYSCEEAKLMAQHIFAAHPNKRRGWATKVLTDVERLNRKVDRPEYAPLSEADREAKRSTQHEISGIEKTTELLCPACNSVHYLKMPVEYLQSQYAWRNGSRLVVNCLSCRK